MRTIVIADDDREFRDSVQALLEGVGWMVLPVADGGAAIQAVQEAAPDAVLLDLKMPGKDGLEALEEIRYLAPSLPVVLLSGKGDIQSAVRAMQSGAYHFLEKPPDPEHLRLVLQRAVERRDLTREVERVRRKEATRYVMIGGESPAMSSFMERLERVSATSSTLLLTGETGTGKELAARQVWENGPRADGPFVAVNCAALNEQLLESDLFGHEKGAFTGAGTAKAGRVEEADGGTLFLDEVGELAPPIQAKLLRFLESGEYHRVGSPTTLTSDVRLIAATNRDLTEKVRAGEYREDLFHRLSVVTLQVPPLRERHEDLRAVTEHHLGALATELGRPAPSLRGEVWARIAAYSWPGNIRELRNVLERALVLSADGKIRAEDIPSDEDAGHGTTSSDDAPEGLPRDLPLDEGITAFKRWFVGRALQTADGNQTRAAEVLGMHRSSLSRLMKELGLR